MLETSDPTVHEIQRTLQARLPQVNPPVLKSVTCGSRVIKLWCVTDPAALYDEVDPQKFAEDEKFPYWSELWPSSVGLATYLVEHGVEKGRSTIELGCGLGLAGVTASLLGASVLFTDFDEDALCFAQENHRQNLGVPGAVQFLDWRNPPRDRTFDLILGADVLYERRFLEPFLDTLQALLSPKGEALVAEPGRTIAAAPLKKLESAGFNRELIAQSCVFEDHPKDVWIHRFTRRL